jgi:fructosamine-3-kinase
MESIPAQNIDRRIGASYAKLAAERALKSTALNASYLGGGSFGMAYKVELEGKPYVAVVKLCKSEGMCEEEALGLRTLKKNTSMHIPEVYFTRLADADIPADCLCMEFIEGVNALKPSFLFYPKRKKQAFANSVIDSMLEYHTCTNAKFGPLVHPVYDTWMDFYRPFAKDVFFTAQKLRGEKKLDSFIADTMEAAWAKFDAIFAEPVLRPALLHGDLNVMNIMVEQKSFTPVAFIDPLNAMYGDREFDLFQLNNLTGKAYGLYDLYKSKYPVSKNCDIKCAFYGLWNEISVFIKTGKMFKLILYPLVRNMLLQLASPNSITIP